jgi:hypothetical protein
MVFFIFLKQSRKNFNRLRGFSPDCLLSNFPGKDYVRAPSVFEQNRVRRSYLNPITLYDSDERISYRIHEPKCRTTVEKAHENR